MQCRCKVAMDVIVDVVGVFFLKKKTPLKIIWFSSKVYSMHCTYLKLHNYGIFSNFFFFFFFQWHKIKHVFSVHSDKKKCYKASRRWQYPWFHLIKLVIKELKADIVMPIYMVHVNKDLSFLFPYYWSTLWSAKLEQPYEKSIATITYISSTITKIDPLCQTKVEMQHRNTDCYNSI